MNSMFARVRVFAILVFIVLLSGCNLFSKKAKIASVSIDQSSLSDSYNIDEFDITKIKILVIYSNDTQESINLSLEMIPVSDQEKLKVAGKHEIEINYLGHKTTLNIKINDKITEQLTLIYQLALSENKYTGTYEDWLKEIKGENGLGIKAIKVDEIGHLIVTLSDDSTIDAGIIINKKHLVSFKDYNGYVLDVQLIEDGKAAKAPIKPSHDGRVFNSWSIDFSNIKTDTEVVATYDLLNYQVTVNNLGKEIIKEVQFGEKVTLEVPQQSGYVFGGWYLDSNYTKEFDIESPITKDIELFARWVSEEQLIIMLFGPLKVEVNKTDTYYVLTEPEILTDLVEFATSDSNIATITQEGILTAKAIGTVIVYANYKDYAAILEVEIVKSSEATLDDLIAEPSINIKFRVPFGSAIQPTISELVASFNEEYPNVNITIDYIGGYDAMKQTTIYDIYNGTTPTMIVGYPDHFAEYITHNAIISLEDYINSNDSRIGYNEQEINDFFPGYLNEVTSFDNYNTIMGLPFNKSTEVMYYNLDFFEYYNLTVPKTWEEVSLLSTEINKKLATPEDTNLSWLTSIKTNFQNNEFIPLMNDSGSNLFTTIIHQFGGKYTQAAYKPDGSIDLNNGELSFVNDLKALQALTYLQELSKNRVMNLPTVFDEYYGSGLIINGNTVMNIGSSAGSYYYNNDYFKIGYAPIPYHENKSIIQQGTNVAIMSQASKLEKLAAWLFIKHCLTPENTAKFAIDTGYLPVRKSATLLPVYQQFLNNPTADQKAFSSVSKVVTDYHTNNWEFFVDPAWNGSSLVRQEVDIAINNILVNGIDVQKAFNDAKSGYEN